MADKSRMRQMKKDFSVQFTDSDRVKTKVSSYAFRNNLLIEFTKLGGTLKLTWGVEVRSHDQVELNKFSEWFDANVQDLCEPRDMVGLFFKKYVGD